MCGKYERNRFQSRIAPGSGREISSSIGALEAPLTPQSAYFYSDRGLRSALLVMDLKDSTQIPEFVEPLFMGLDAQVEITPVMNAQELQAGLAKIAKK